MSEPTPQIVMQALTHVIDRDSGQNVVEAGLISGVAVRGGKVGFLITIEPKDKDSKAWLREACEHAVKKIPGVESVTAVLTAQNAEPLPLTPANPQPRERAHWNLTPVEHVKRVIAVASGKGGVGKSTVTVNLALALAATGKRVGILDADIYGPSMPRMLGLSGQPDIKEGKMQPLRNHSIAAMSIGFITGSEAAIMRGPMISKSLMQMLRGTSWGSEKEPLDILLLDMPPGTGDVHLSMAQQVPLDGAIIVTTPQEVALADARKAAIMFQKVNVPLMGVIENMSWLEDASGSKNYLFGKDGGPRLAAEFNVPLLGQIALDSAIGAAGDSGGLYQGSQQQAFTAIAQRL